MGDHKVKRVERLWAMISGPSALPDTTIAQVRESTHECNKAVTPAACGSTYPHRERRRERSWTFPGRIVEDQW